MCSVPSHGCAQGCILPVGRGALGSCRVRGCGAYARTEASWQSLQYFPPRGLGLARERGQTHRPCTAISMASGCGHGRGHIGIIIIVFVTARHGSRETGPATSSSELPTASTYWIGPSAPSSSPYNHCNSSRSCVASVQVCFGLINTKYSS